MDDELLQRLEEHYEARGGTPRWRLRGQVFLKSLAWKCVVGSAYVAKRLLDLILASLAVIFASPVMLITIAAIKLEDGGPVIFLQERVGRRGRHLLMYKFRSMRIDAEQIKEELGSRNETGGITFKMKNDPRVTKVGRIIRKLSIDELPQLFNVIKGDMSLVGPRPPLVKEVAQYDYPDRRRLEAVPGITCLWQIGGRSDIDFKGQVCLDVRYIQSQSLWGDMKILLLTIPSVLFGKGAY